MFFVSRSMFRFNWWSIMHSKYKKKLSYPQIYKFLSLIPGLVLCVHSNWKRKSSEIDKKKFLSSREREELKIESIEIEIKHKFSVYFFFINGMFFAAFSIIFTFYFISFNSYVFFVSISLCTSYICVWFALIFISLYTSGRNWNTNKYIYIIEEIKFLTSAIFEGQFQWKNIFLKNSARSSVCDVW